MRSLLIGLTVLCLTTAPAHPQCCGDCDGSGTVDIADVIRAVNVALGGTCEEPRDGCPYTFDGLSLSRRCAFSGRFNATCGGFLQAVVSVDDDVAAVVLSTNPAVGFIAERTSATSATLLAWSVAPFDEGEPVSGSVQLLGGGAELAIFPDEAPFRYLGCDFLGYIGAFDQTVGRQNFTRTR